MAKAGMRNTSGIDSGTDATPLGLGYSGRRSSQGSLRPAPSFALRCFGGQAGNPGLKSVSPLGMKNLRHPVQK